MSGLEELNAEVQRVLTIRGASPSFRLWKNRLKKGKLSIEIKMRIVEEFGNKEVLLTLKDKENGTE